MPGSPTPPAAARKRRGEILQRKSETALRRGFALIVVACLALVALEIYQIGANAPQLRRSRELVVHTFEVITTAQALDRALQDAERGQRGFLITEDPVFLEPYRNGARDARPLLAKLQELLTGDSDQQRRLSAMEAQVDLKLRELQRGLDAREAQGFDAARQIIQNRIGLEAM